MGLAEEIHRTIVLAMMVVVKPDGVILIEG